MAAGDLLVYKCPTWTWAAGEPSRSVSYLPAEKQFLITRAVPCSRRFHSDSSSGGADFYQYPLLFLSLLYNPHIIIIVKNSSKIHLQI